MNLSYDKINKVIGIISFSPNAEMHMRDCEFIINNNLDNNEFIHTLLLTSIDRDAVIHGFLHVMIQSIRVGYNLAIEEIEVKELERLKNL